MRTFISIIFLLLGFASLLAFIKYSFEFRDWRKAMKAREPTEGSMTQTDADAMTKRAFIIKLSVSLVISVAGFLVFYLTSS